MLGVEVAAIEKDSRPAGNYTAEFDASNLPPGMYTASLATQSGTIVAPLIIEL